MLVRRRTEEDLDDCQRLMLEVHAVDGYPHLLPADPRPFIASADALATWVAEEAGEIVGHVALHRRNVAEAMAVASAYLRLPPDQLGVVARLFVSPEVRRAGVGRALLRVASEEAVDRGLWPVLDVAPDFVAAITLYETCGWIRAGKVIATFGANSLEEFVYVGPAPREAHTA
jgi:GNAT superfamily N-acetyltransferase